MAEEATGIREAANDAASHSRSRTLFVLVSRKARVLLTNARTRSPSISADALLMLFDELFSKESQVAALSPSTSSRQVPGDEIIRLAIADVLIDGATKHGKAFPQALATLARALALPLDSVTSFPYLLLSLIASLNRLRQSSEPSASEIQSRADVAGVFSAAIESGLPNTESLQGIASGKWDLLYALLLAHESNVPISTEIVQAVKWLSNTPGITPAAERLLAALSAQSGLPHDSHASGPLKQITNRQGSHLDSGHFRLTRESDASERAAQRSATATVVLNHLLTASGPWDARVNMVKMHVRRHLAWQDDATGPMPTVWSDLYSSLLDAALEDITHSDLPAGGNNLLASVPHLLAELETYRLAGTSNNKKDAAGDGIVAAGLAVAVKKRVGTSLQRPAVSARDGVTSPVAKVAHVDHVHLRINGLIKSLESLNLIRVSLANSLYIKSSDEGEGVPPQNLLQQLRHEAQDRGESLCSYIANEYLNAGESFGSGLDSTERITQLFDKLNSSPPDMIVAREVGSAAVESFRTSTAIATASLNNLSAVCTALLDHRTALSNILLFKSAEDLLHPLLPVLDDEETLDHLCGPGAAGDDEPGMLSRVIIFAQWLCRRLDAETSHLLFSPSVRLMLALRDVPAAPPLNDLDSESERPLVCRWIKELFDSDGVGDELIKDSPPRVLLKLGPVLFSQSLTAAELGVIDSEMLRNGLSFFLQDLLNYALPAVLDWLMVELRKCRSLKPFLPPSVAPSALSRRAELISSVLSMLLLDEHCPSHAFALVADRLHALLQDGIYCGQSPLANNGPLADLASAPVGETDSKKPEEKVADAAAALKTKLEEIRRREPDNTVSMPSHLDRLFDAKASNTGTENGIARDTSSNEMLASLNMVLTLGDARISTHGERMRRPIASILTHLAGGGTSDDVSSVVLALLASVLSTPFCHSHQSGVDKLNGSQITTKRSHSARLIQTFTMLGLLPLHSTRVLIPSSKAHTTTSSLSQASYSSWDLESSNIESLRWRVLTLVLSLVAQAPAGTDESLDPEAAWLKDLADLTTLLAWRRAGDSLSGRGETVAVNGAKRPAGRKDGEDRSRLVSRWLANILEPETDQALPTGGNKRKRGEGHSESTNDANSRDFGDMQDSAMSAQDHLRAGACEQSTAGVAGVAIARKRALAAALAASLRQLQTATIDVCNAFDDPAWTRSQTGEQMQVSSGEVFGQADGDSAAPEAHDI
ncbi:unnamed protein product [Parajaminaea phylloscopi]